MSTNLKFLSLTLVFNLWTWKLLSFNFLLGLLTLATSVTLYFALARKNKFHVRNFVVLFCLLLLFQLKTTPETSLTLLDNDEQRVQQMRLREYPPVYLKIAGKTLWLPVAHWFEGRKETIAFSRIKKNLFETLDLNQYFFTGHPRERVGVIEFEKFPYILLPFFVAGLVVLATSKTHRKLFSWFLPSLFLTMLAGTKNPLGPFSLFPFFSIAITYGGGSLHHLLRPYLGSKRLILAVAILVFTLVFIQVIAYAIH